MILDPVPAAVPSQLPVNHCIVAPVPADPPDMVNVVEAPLQIDELPRILVGAVDKVWTVTVALAHEVVLQEPI